MCIFQCVCFDYGLGCLELIEMGVADFACVVYAVRSAPFAHITPFNDAKIYKYIFFIDFLTLRETSVITFSDALVATNELSTV